MSAKAYTNGSVYNMEHETQRKSFERMVHEAVREQLAKILEEPVLSEIGQALERQRKPEEKYLTGLPTKARPIDIRLDRSRTLELINEARVEANQDGWHGEGSIAISDDVYECALRLLSLLPDNLHTPEVVAEPDGWIEFEWFPRSWHKVSVSVGAENMVSYVAFHGDPKEQEHGTSVLGISIPLVIGTLFDWLASIE